MTHEVNASLSSHNMPKEHTIVQPIVKKAIQQLIVKGFIDPFQMFHFLEMLLRRWP